MDGKRSVNEYLGWAVTGIVTALAGALGFWTIPTVPAILEGNLSAVVVWPFKIVAALGIGCPPYGGAILTGSALGGLLGGWGFTTLFRRRGRLGAIIGGFAVAALSAVYFSFLGDRCFPYGLF